MNTNLEMTAKEKKQLYMREYMKKYQKNRKEIDPEFAEKHKEYVRNNLKNRWNTDPEYREKKREADKNRYNKYKEAYTIINSQNTAV